MAGGEEDFFLDDVDFQVIGIAIVAIICAFWCIRRYYRRDREIARRNRSKRNLKKKLVKKDSESSSDEDIEKMVGKSPSKRQR